MPPTTSLWAKTEASSSPASPTVCSPTAALREPVTSSWPTSAPPAPSTGSDNPKTTRGDGGQAIAVGPGDQGLRHRRSLRRPPPTKPPPTASSWCAASAAWAPSSGPSPSPLEASFAATASRPVPKVPPTSWARPRPPCPAPRTLARATPSSCATKATVDSAGRDTSERLRSTTPPAWR